MLKSEQQFQHTLKKYFTARKTALSQTKESHPSRTRPGSTACSGARTYHMYLELGIPSLVSVDQSATEELEGPSSAVNEKENPSSLVE